MLLVTSRDFRARPRALPAAFPLSHCSPPFLNANRGVIHALLPGGRHTGTRDEFFTTGLPNFGSTHHLGAQDSVFVCVPCAGGWAMSGHSRGFKGDPSAVRAPLMSPLPSGWEQMLWNTSCTCLSRSTSETTQLILKIIGQIPAEG